VLEPAESAGLLEIDNRVRFRHPLARSAVYGAASLEERRRVHRALAEATNAELDPDRRAWHLAEAAARPDEEVAAELEQAAGRAQARGGLAAAAAFLERSAALTLDPSRRTERALATAQSKYEAGFLKEALGLLANAETGVLDPLQRGRVDLMHAQIAFTYRRGSDAPPLLLKAARQLEAVDPSLARATYLEAVSAARFAGRLAPDACLREVGEAALAGPAAPQPPRPPDLLLKGLALRATEGYGAGAPVLKQALSAFAGETVTGAPEARWFLLACWVASDLWDDENLVLLSTRELERARGHGALSAVPLALDARGWVHSVCGELPAAAALLDEMRSAAEATGIAIVPYSPLWLAALQGNEAELSQLIETMVSDAVSRGEGFALAVTELVTGVLYNGLGRYNKALVAMHRAVDVERASQTGSPRAVIELIEAAVRSGDRALAQRVLEQLAERTRISGTEWALGLEARSRALLSDGEIAESLYRDAIERLGRTRMRVDHARAYLLYGEWLRRERRRVDAREHLRTALEMFTSMGTDAFAGRAERELLATGARARKRSVETRADLTPQEAQVARFARDGLSNADIGERLFISQHTVAYHLRKVFTKLNITSRNQLHRALPAEPAAIAV
jgi:DNA-binding CsgD family transcriptional regulator